MATPPRVSLTLNPGYSPWYFPPSDRLRWAPVLGTGGSATGGGSLFVLSLRLMLSPEDSNGPTAKGETGRECRSHLDAHSQRCGGRREARAATCFVYLRLAARA